MSWDKLNKSMNRDDEDEERNSFQNSGIGASADALLALNALLSASTGSAPIDDNATSGVAENLSSLLDTLANFSSKVNNFSSGGGGNNYNDGNNVAEIQRQEFSNTNSTSAEDIASLLFAGLTNTKNEPEPSTVDDYDRYEREREEKFRELEAKFAFLSPKTPKVVRKQQQETVPPNQTSSAKDAFAASARKVFASPAMKEFLSGFQKNRSSADNEKVSPLLASTSATIPKSFSTKKRRTRSNSIEDKKHHRTRSSSSSSQSSTSSHDSSNSGTDSDRSISKSKKKRGGGERKKKSKKFKKDKQKNGKNASQKQTKLKKDLLEAERKAVSDNVAKLKGALGDYEKRRRTLDEELSRLKKQHNEMCRKLQRQKSDPRKDTLIIDNEALQTDIERHLKNLDKQKENDAKILETEEKRLEKLRKQSKVVKKEDGANSAKKSGMTALREKSPAKKPKEEVEYFDPGSHWCKNCNAVSTNVYDWLEHLHSQKHKSNMDSLDRPWMPEQEKALLKRQGVASLKPFKGVEFLMPSTAFYCNLCKEFSGDSLSAEAHLKGFVHNEKYQAYVETNPFYERREMLEKAAAVSHRLEKSAASSKLSINSVNNDDSKKPYYRSSAEKTSARLPEPQRIPHKPNESGKIKPFQVAAAASSSSSTADKKYATKKEEKNPHSRLVIKMDGTKPVSVTTAGSSSTMSLKKPHSSFDDARDSSKYDGGRHSDRKRHRDR